MIIEVEGEDAGSLDIVPQVSWTGPIPFPGEVGVVVSGRSKSQAAGTGLERGNGTRVARLVRSG